MAGWIRVLDDASGRIELLPAALDGATASVLQRELESGIPWVRHRVRMFGRELPAPRLSSWHGEPEASYRYSGVRHVPLPWTPPLLDLRQRLAAWLPAASFNSVLLNWYRDGREGMGWHADDEPELGPRPLIASLSLGAERDFLLRPRAGGSQLRLPLPHGSLLLMAGATQQHWLHALPRRARVQAGRINLTFRRIEPRP